MIDAHANSRMIINDGNDSLSHLIHSLREDRILTILETRTDQSKASSTLTQERWDSTSGVFRS